MKLSLIVAADVNGVIGLHGEMPWEKMSADLKFFKNTTTNHWCILGRKTYNALGNKVLPGRKFIIVTRDADFVSADSITANSITAAMQAKEIANEEQVFILGGGEIYKQAIHYADRVYLTRIYAAFKGDTFFYIPDPENWKVVSQEDFNADEKNPYDYSFILFERIKTLNIPDIE